MPIYSFRCPECGQGQDVALRMSEVPMHVEHCRNPQCSRTTGIERVPTSASIAFKGAGWTPKFHSK